MTTSIPAIYVPRTILFLGSGFSKAAQNIRKKNLPVGGELKVELATLAKVDPEPYSLTTIADEVAARGGLNLYQALYELFTVRQLAEHQKDILSLPWLRIYTTNYDDAVEFAYQQAGITPRSYNYDTPKPRRILPGSVVHLHGSIRTTDEDNVLQQLVLNENSYVRQHFENSPWYEEFVRDIRYGDACYFVGYSLSDYHISALLMQNPAFAAKTFFITQPNVDEVFRRRVEPYGRVLPAGAEAFAKHCLTQSTTAPSVEPHALKTFKFLDPFKDKKSLAPPTPQEVLSLVAFGNFNYQRCLSTLPEAKYVAPRQKLAQQAVELLSESKCLLVHSRLGNGKTIFLNILAHKLSETGHRCFLFRSNAPPLAEDIEALKGFEKVVVLFDSYNSAIEMVDYFNDFPEQTRFVVSVRTGVQEVRLHEIQERLPRPLKRLSLNGLDKDDKEDFIDLLNQSGIRTSRLEQDIQESGDVREIVVSLYDNEAIRKKIRDELTPLLDDPDFKSVFIASHLLGWIGHDPGPAFLRSVTQRDAYAVMSKFREVAGDVVRMDDDDIQIRSAVFSEYLIGQHFSTADVLDISRAIVIEAVKRKRERRYQPILSSLMQVSNLKRLLNRDPDNLAAIRRSFEQLVRDIDINKEPLFWLQYTILMVELSDLQQAEGFLETAYLRARENPGFLTYQIDTQALRVYLLTEQSSPEKLTVARFDKIMEKTEMAISMITDASHRNYAIRASEGFEPFATARAKNLTADQRNLLAIQLDRIAGALNDLPAEVRANSGSDAVKASVERAKSILITQ